MLTHYSRLRLLIQIFSDLAYRKYDGGHPHRCRDALSCKYAVFFFWVDCSNLIMALQLAQRRRDTAGLFSDHTLLKIVRLIIETNVMTSMGILAPYALNHHLIYIQHSWVLFLFS
jgi:hypothetical protein